MDTYLASLVIREQNMQQFLKVMQDLTVTDEDVVTIEFVLPDGSTKTYEAQSISSIMSRVKNLENNIKELANLDNISNATIILPDGTIRSIIVAEQATEPKTFVVDAPTAVVKKENFLKHLFIDPFVFAKVPVSRVSYPSYDKVKINKVILTLDTPDKLGYFDTIKNKQVEYDDVIVGLDKNGISRKETYIESFLASSQYQSKGVFDILNISKKSEVISNVDPTDTSLVYKLNTLFYKNRVDDTDIYIKVGHKIYVGENTTYVIDFVDKSTNHIGLTLVKGFEPVTIGVEKLLFLGDIEEPYAEIPLSAGEYCIVFIRPVNTDMLIESTEWGIGYSFFSDDLLSGITVNNFWKSVEAVSNENLIPSTEFVPPSKPVLSGENFDVVLVNKHKNNSDSVMDIKKKFSEKTKVESDYKMIQDDIRSTETTIATTPTEDNATRTKLTAKLTSLKEDLQNKSRELNSAVNDLNTVSTQLDGFKPKYEIHGFISEGDAVFVNGVVQNIIGYDVEYRYVSSDAKVDENKSFDLKSELKSKKAIIPKWLKMPVPKIKQKTIAGKWVDEDLGDVDQLNINQITIPISTNEIVEIRARAISEVGYPFQTNYSEWSDVIKISFPDTIKDTSETIIELSKTDVVYNRVYEKLVELGLTIHNVDSLSITEKYYAHFLRNIGTNKLTPENKPIDAQTLIDSVIADVLDIRNTLGSLSGLIKVKILAEDQTVIAEVSNNGTVKYLDEYYKNLVEDLNVKKGAIINRILYIEITNIADGDIELFPFVTGVSTDKLVGSYSGYTYNSDEYNNFRQFYNAPLSRLDVIEDADFLLSKAEQYPFVEIKSFQSSQVKSQGVYSRAKDITLTENLFDGTVLSLLVPIFSVSGTQPFIWNGSQTIIAPVGGGGYTDFCVHVDHPLLQLSSDLMQNWIKYYSTGAERTLPKQTYDAQKAYYPPFMMDAFATDANSLKQMIYREYESVSTGATASNFPNKIGFEDNDKYLIGKNTCGLFLSLASSSDLFLNEKFVNQGKKIKKGERYLIPILASSRLTDYYGAGSAGIGNIGGEIGKTNVSYTKKIGIDILVKESKLELPKLLSFDFQYTMQYEKSSLN